MTFLSHLDDETRQRLDAASDIVAPQAGDWLVRSGDPGGDLYVIEEGGLEVLEHRPEGERAIATLGPGDIVGELAFLDDSPRSADVRCQTAVRARRWTREDLHDLLRDHPDLAARVYDALARTVAARLRHMARTQKAPPPPSESTVGDARRWIRAVDEVAERAKTGMEQAHLLLRRHDDEVKAKATIHNVLRDLQETLSSSRPLRPEPQQVSVQMQRLRRELRPWVSGSWLAMRLIDAPESAVIQGDVYDHVIQGQPRGEGRIGTHVEHWLMHTPTMVSRRSTESGMIGRLAEIGPQRAIWLDAPSPGRMRLVGAALAPHQTHLLVIDGSRAVLALAREALSSGGLDHVDTVHETPLRIALGRSDEHLPQQDVVVLGGLLAYLPDRLAVPTLALAASLLRPGGRVLLDLPAESAPDDALWADLFRWPLIRRSEARTLRMFERARLDVAYRGRGDAPGEVVELRASAAPPARPPHV